MTKAIPLGYIDPIKNNKGITYRAKVRVRDKSRPTGYYEKNATFNTKKEAGMWRDDRIQKLTRGGVPTSRVSCG